MPLSNVTGFYIPISSPHLPTESCTCLIYWPLDIPSCNFYKLLLKLFPFKAILLCLRKRSVTSFVFSAVVRGIISSLPVGK